MFWEEQFWGRTLYFLFLRKKKLTIVYQPRLILWIIDTISQKFKGLENEEESSVAPLVKDTIPQFGI